MSLSLSGLRWAKKTGILKIGTLTIMTVDNTSKPLHLRIQIKQKLQNSVTVIQGLRLHSALISILSIKIK